MCKGQLTIPFKSVPNFYTFSNINNGWPKDTCQEPMYTELKTMINFYFMRVASVAAFIGVVLLFFFCILCGRVKKVLCKDRSKTDQLKKRAINGMVVGEDGFDDEDIDPNKRKKMKKLPQNENNDTEESETGKPGKTRF